MMVSRSSSHGRLPSSQQPRQGSRQSKKRSSNGASLTHKETPVNKSRLNEAPSHMLLSSGNGGPGSRIQQTTNALLNMS
jgi:hypothetical protein